MQADESQAFAIRSEFRRSTQRPANHSRVSDFSGSLEKMFTELPCGVIWRNPLPYGYVAISGEWTNALRHRPENSTKHDDIGIGISNFSQHRATFAILSSNVGEENAELLRRLYVASDRLPAGGIESAVAHEIRCKPIKMASRRSRDLPAPATIAASTRPRQASIRGQINVAREGVEPDQKVRAVVISKPQYCDEADERNRHEPGQRNQHVAPATSADRADARILSARSGPKLSSPVRRP